MKTINRIIGLIWEKLFVLGGVLYVLLPTSPLNMPLTYADSGVFHYMGWRILNGDIPYKEVWDHKPPIIFFIDALGLSIIDHPRWGVWFLELIFLFFSFWIAFIILKKHFGIYSAIAGVSIGFLTLPFLIHGGNFSEEYAMLWYFLALWVFVAKKPDETSFLLWTLIGILGGLTFFTKQTTIGLWIAILIYVSILRFKNHEILLWLKQVGAMLCGATVITGIILAYFLVNDAVKEFWDAAFSYNFIYSSDVTDLSSRLRPILVGIKPLLTTGIFQLALLGFGIGLVKLCWGQYEKDIDKALLSVLLLNFPIEILLVSVSGQYPVMYYMTLLPVLIMLAGILFFELFSIIARSNLPKKASVFFLGIILAALGWSTIYDYRNEIDSLSHMESEIVIDYIRKNTEPGDHVLGWGAESFLNYFSKRESPTRFVYQFPLYRRGYVNEEKINEFLDSIIANRPKLIIDNKRPDAPIFEFPISSPAIQEKLSILKSEYTLSVTMIDNLGLWDIYEIKEEE